ncbi:MAG: hypothetical protein JWN62_4710 [Acidimicrobiales bacterium]|nr:hypothetical protein [Acidimicrobiales bacterium]
MTRNQTTSSRRHKDVRRFLVVVLALSSAACASQASVATTASGTDASTRASTDPTATSPAPSPSDDPAAPLTTSSTTATPDPTAATAAAPVPVASTPPTAEPLAEPQLALTIPLDGTPSAIATTTFNDHSFVWVAIQPASGTGLIEGIDATTNAVVTHVERSGTVSFAHSPLNPALLITCSPNDIQLIDASVGGVVQTVPAPCTSTMAVDHQGNLWFEDDAELVELGPDFSPLARIRLDSPGAAVGVGSGSVWAAQSAPGSTSITRVDPASHQIVATIPLPNPATNIVADGSTIWVTTAAMGSPGSPTLLGIDPASNTVTSSDTITAPDASGTADVAATGLDMSGGQLWAVDALGNTSVMDTNTNLVADRPRLLDPTDTAADDRVLAADGAIWLTRSAPDELIRVDPGTLGYSVNGYPQTTTHPIRAEIASGCPASIGNVAEFSSTAALFVTNPTSADLQNTFVPGAPTVAMICRYTAAQPVDTAISRSGVSGGTLAASRQLDSYDAAALADTLNSIIPSDIMSGCLVGQDGARYTAIVFAVPNRADVDVWLKDWIGCPEVTNGTHSSGELINGNGTDFTTLLDADLPPTPNPDPYQPPP